MGGSFLSFGFIVMIRSKQATERVSLQRGDLFFNGLKI